MHPTVINVLLCFLRHQVAFTTDVNPTYRAVLISEHQGDLHRFMCRKDSQKSLKHYRMMTLTFGVSASPFIAIMAMRQNALDHQRMYPLDAQAVMDSFYVDDGLDGADSIDEAIKLWDEMQELFKTRRICAWEMEVE